MSISTELENLHKLHESGVLTQSEFVKAKDKLLNNPLVCWRRTTFVNAEKEGIYELIQTPWLARYPDCGL